VLGHRRSSGGARHAQGSGGAWPRRSAQARGADAVPLGAQDGNRAESGSSSTWGGDDT